LKYIFFIATIASTIVCYSDGSDPGNTIYCRSAGSVIKDQKCKYEEDPDSVAWTRNAISFPLRCSDPQRVILESSKVCYTELSNNLIYEITVSESTMSASPLLENSISISSNKHLGYLCFNGAGDPFQSFFSQKNSFYEFETDTRTANKVIWNQDPESEKNKELVKNRHKNLKNYIVPLLVSNLTSSKWIVVVSSCTASMFNAPFGYYYQILEVKP